MRRRRKRRLGATNQPDKQLVLDACEYKRAKTPIGRAVRLLCRRHGFSDRYVMKKAFDVYQGKIKCPRRG